MSRAAAVRGALAVGAAGAVIVLGALPAAAHTELIDVTPGPGEVVVEGGQVTVTLTFTEAIDPAFATVVVVDSAGQVVTTDPVRVDGADVSQVLPSLAAGAYDVRYRVVSSDGHPVDGASDFSVQAAPEPTSAPPATDAATATTTPTTTATAEDPASTGSSRTAAAPTVPTSGTDGEGGGATLALGLGATALVVAVGGGALAVRRRAAGSKGARVDG